MVDFVQQPEKNVNGHALLNNAADDIPKTALSREAYLLGGGIKDGFLDRVNQAKEHLGMTALEFGGAVAIGAGLTAMHMAGGRWNAAANIASQGLKVMALADGVRRAVPTLFAMGDTLVNPEHYLENRATVASYLGSACFDYPLMAAGGMLGSSAAYYGPRAVNTLASKFGAGEVGAKPIDTTKIDLDALNSRAPKSDWNSTLSNKFADKGLAPPTDTLLNSGVPINAETRAAVEAMLKSSAAGDASVKMPNNGLKQVLAELQPPAANAEGMAINPTVLKSKVIIWDEQGIKSIKNPSSGPFNHHDFTIKPFDLKIPELIQQSSVRTSVIPIIPLPIWEQQIELKKQEK